MTTTKCHQSGINGSVYRGVVGAEEIQRQAAQLEEDMENAAPQRQAFKTYKPALKDRLTYAADYTDEWFKLPGQQGSSASRSAPT